MKSAKTQTSKIDLSGKKKKTKTFMVTINWYGEILKFYTNAGSEKIALANAMRRLSKKLNVTFIFVKTEVLDHNKDRWKVEEIKECKNTQKR